MNKLTSTNPINEAEYLTWSANAQAKDLELYILEDKEDNSARQPMDTYIPAFLNDEPIVEQINDLIDIGRKSYTELPANEKQSLLTTLLNYLADTEHFPELLDKFFAKQIEEQENEVKRENGMKQSMDNITGENIWR